MISILGAGGMGVVWRAHDHSLRRDAALKILSQQEGQRGDGRGLNAELFMQEARAIAKLQHPAVVSVFEVGQDGGQIFLALELMEGGTLKDWVERYGRIPPRELWAMMIGPARALALAHRRGIIHRDIKPTNLMFDDLGHLKLMDFGLADVAQDMVSKRMRGKTVGSLGWISPETARGEGTTAASDIYSMGLSMLYALTGRPWLRARSKGEMIELHRNPPELDLSEIKGLTPKGATILKTCMAIEQSDRYLTADRLADALQECADEDPTELSRKRRGHASVAVVAAVLSGLVVSTVVLRYFVNLFDRESELRQPVTSILPPPPARSEVAVTAVPGEAMDVDSGTAAIVAETEVPGRPVEEGDRKSIGTEDLRRPWAEVFGNVAFKFVGSKKDRFFHLGTSECGRSIYASDLVWFGSIEEAIEAGREPCPKCLPTADKKIGVAVGPENDWGP